MKEKRNLFKMSKLMRSKKRKIIICAELMLILTIAAALIIRNKTYSVNIYDAEESMIKLAGGRYIVTVEYEETDDNLFVWLSDESGLFESGKIFDDPQRLPHLKESHSYEMWVTGMSENVKFNLEYMTDNIGKISSITIEQTRFARIFILLQLLIIFMLTIFICAVRDRIISMKTVEVVLCIFCITVIASLPVFTKYIPLGFDSYFHCMRIEGIKDGLLAGQFPVKVEPTYLRGHGYAVSTFYGSLFMYVPALLRLIGFSLQFCYKFLLFFINLMMAVCSYLFFKEASKSRRYGIIGSALYTLSMYKFCNTFYRGAIGEATAMAVLPIIALGLWNIYTKPYDEKYKYRWILPALGFTALIQSHLISTEIAGAFTVIICLVLFRKTFKKQTLSVLVKTVFFSLILNIGFLVPLFESLNKLSLAGNQWDNVSSRLQETGILLRNIFSFQIPVFTTEVWYKQEYFIGLGTCMLLVILVSVYVFIRQIINKKLDIKFMFIAAISFFSVLVVTRHFPWNSIIDFFRFKMGEKGVFIANMIANLQYSYRISIVTTLFLALLAVISLKKLEYMNRRATKVLLILILSICCVQCVLLEASIITTQYNSEEQIAFVNEENEGINLSVGMGEYMPLNSSGEWADYGKGYQYSTSSSGLEVLEYEKNYTNVNIRIKNNTNDVGLVNLPLFYYLGYSAKDINTGESISIFKSDTGNIVFVVEGGIERNIYLKYTGKPWWRVCEAVSLVCFLWIVYLIFRIKCKKL